MGIKRKNSLGNYDRDLRNTQDTYTCEYMNPALKNYECDGQLRIDVECNIVEDTNEHGGELRWDS